MFDTLDTLQVIETVQEHEYIVQRRVRAGENSRTQFLRTILS